jgi:pimeloyl-ACP methyl ester carboxylesterase
MPWRHRPAGWHNLQGFFIRGCIVVLPSHERAGETFGRGSATALTVIMSKSRSLHFRSRSAYWNLGLAGKALLKERLRLLVVLASLLFMVVGLGAAGRWDTFPPTPPMPPTDKSGYASIGGIQMYYAIYGEGDPILLIHGGLGNGDIWSRQIMDLARDRKVIIADSRGHGRSTFTDLPFSYELMASDYVELLNFLQISKVTIVGWSDGANIGLAMAMSHPELVTALFAHAPNVTTDGLLAGGSRSGPFQAYARKCASEYQRLSRNPKQYSKLTSRLSSMWRSQPKWTRSQLSVIKAPVWVVLGDHDEIIKREHAKYIASVIPDSKLIILKETGHFSIVQDPASYTEAILALVKSIPRGAEQEGGTAQQEKQTPAPEADHLLEKENAQLGEGERNIMGGN